MFSDSNRNARTKLISSLVVLVGSAALTACAGRSAFDPVARDSVTTSYSGPTRSPAATRANPSPYGDEEMAAVRNDDEKKLREIRVKEINQLRTTLGRRLPANRRADLFVRLSESYLEMYRAEFLDEGKVHEKRLEQGQTDKFIDRTHSKPFLRLGIQACEEVLKTGIPHPKLDEIYYFLAVYYDELEDERSSIRYFRELTQKFPSSPYVGEAYRALGESAYAHNEFRDALKNYEAAAHNYQGAAYPRLLHKLAWTQYRLRQYDRAIATLKQAIEKAGKDEKFLNLKDEALRDMAIFMTEGGRVDEALAYFKTVGGDKSFYPATLERLGAQYERNADPTRAIQVYEALLKTAPNDEAAFRVREKMFEIDVRRGNFASGLGRLQAVSIPWKSADVDSQNSIKSLKALLRKTAVDQHDRYRRTQDKNALAVAENYYTSYLTQFLSKSIESGTAGDAEKKEVPEIQMYLAEVKSDLKKSQDAAFLYKQVIRSKDERYAKQAAALWMTSLGSAITDAKKKGVPADQLTSLQRDYIEASDYVAEQFNGKVEALEARLNLAQVLAGNPATADDAVARIKEVVKADAKSKQAWTAAKLWVQIQSDRLPKKSTDAKDSKEARDLAETVAGLRANRDLMDADKDQHKGELAAMMDGLDTKLKIGAIAAQEKAKDYASAARGYEELAKKETKKDVAEKAYDNAVGAYVKAGDYDDAIRLIGEWYGKYKGSKLALEALRDTATNAIIMGQFEKAAGLFRILGRRGDSNALEASGRLFEGTGNLTEAASDFRYYLDTFKDSSQRGPIALSLAQWFEYSKNDPEAVRHYQLCLDENHDTSAECGARLADLYDRLEQGDKANAVFRRVAERGEGSRGKGKKRGGGSDSSPWIGYARYRMALNMETDRHFGPLRLPDDKLKRGLEERLAFLDKLNKEYQKVVEVSGPWAVAALDRLANWVVGFADDVDQIAPPPNSTDNQVQAFRKGLKSVSDPLRGKAIETWKTAYQKALQGELLSPVLPQIAEKLASLGVAPPSRAQGFRDKWRLSGQPADGGELGKAAAFEKARKSLLDNAKSVQAWIDYGNLLWGEGRPLLAKIAYERALGLNPRAAAALNNRGVLIVSGSGQEDWIRVAEANQFFKGALAKDDMFLAAKFNRGALLNYYRLFAKAKPYWQQVLAVNQHSDVADGLAISQQGLGDLAEAAKAFARGDKAGGASDRTSRVLFDTQRTAVENPTACSTRMESLLQGPTMGFERTAAEGLKSYCDGMKAKSGK